MENNKNVADYDQSDKFLRTLFANLDFSKQGQIEMRPMSNGKPEPAFFSEIKGAAEYASKKAPYMNVYCGVNPRVGGAGKKVNIHYLTAFHVDVDYGKDGHKKDTEFGCYEDALQAIKGVDPAPTMIIHTGGGFHVYWVMQDPLSVKDYSVEFLESINLGIITACNGDRGTHDLPRILRVPGTFNMKTQAEDGSYRKVSIIDISGKYYSLDDMKTFLPKEVDNSIEDITAVDNVRVAEKPMVINTKSNTLPVTAEVNVNYLGVSQRVKMMITNGYDTKSKFSSRSEFDLAVILGLVSNNININIIQNIFEKYPVGKKYRSHAEPGKYLKHTIDKADGLVGLTEEQREDPLFLSGSIKLTKDDLFLDVICYQEFVCQKEKIIYIVSEESFYGFTGIYYKKLTDDEVNNICQKNLGGYRRLFKNAKFKEFLHFAVGSQQRNIEDFNADQKRYLTLKNFNFDLHNNCSVPHSPNIFTTAFIPYNFGIFDKCPRWKQFLNEIFCNDIAKVNFVQEIIGYVFHPALPMPALFFLIGNGNNGKSVFLNILRKLVGEFNTASIPLHKLADERFIPILENKFVNICSETPNRKQLDMDIIKAVTGGDSISGRRLYKEAKNYTFFAKHFLAMNNFPEIMDNSLGLKRRVYIIEFPRTFSKDEVDVYLEDKLTKELSGIFNWAIEGLTQIKKNNFQFTQSTEMIDKKDEYLSNSNDVINFVKDIFPKEANSLIKLKEAYDLFVDDCRKHGQREIMKKNEFKQILINGGYKIDNSSKYGNQVCIEDILF